MMLREQAIQMIPGGGYGNYKALRQAYAWFVQTTAKTGWLESSEH